MLVGMGSPVATVPISAAATREVDVLGSFRYANTYKEALQLLAASSSALAALNPIQVSTGAGKVTGVLPDVRCLITHRFALHDARDAFELVQRGADTAGNLALKVMVVAGVDDEESSDDD